MGFILNIRFEQTPNDVFNKEINGRAMPNSGGKGDASLLSPWTFLI
jgi:hypothetical protein